MVYLGQQWSSVERSKIQSRTGWRPLAFSWKNAGSFLQRSIKAQCAKSGTQEQIRWMTRPVDNPPKVAKDSPIPGARPCNNWISPVTRRSRKYVPEPTLPAPPARVGPIGCHTPCRHNRLPLHPASVKSLPGPIQPRFPGQSPYTSHTCAKPKSSSLAQGAILGSSRATLYCPA